MSVLSTVVEVSGQRDSSTVRVDLSEQYQSQEQEWRQVLAICSTIDEALVDRAGDRLRELMSQEDSAIQSLNWGEDGFSGCIVRPGPRAMYFDSSRPVLLTNEGRRRVGRDASSSPLCTLKDLQKLGIRSSMDFERAISLDGAGPLLTKGLSPAERLKNGDNMHNLPMSLPNMYKLMLALQDSEIAELLLIGALYMCMCMATIQSDVSWSTALREGADYLGSGGPIHFPLPVEKPTRRVWREVTVDGVYTDLGCTSPFAVDPKYSSRLPFLVSRSGLKLGECARTVLDMHRVWSVVAAAMDMYLYSRLERAYELRSLQMRYEIIRAVWNVGSRGVKNIGKHINNAYAMCSGFYCPIPFIGADLVVVDSASNPIIEGDLRGIRTLGASLTIKWKKLQYVNRARIFGDQMSHLNALRENGLHAWYDLFASMDGRFADIGCVVNEPLQFLGYSYSDPTYELCFTTNGPDLPQERDPETERVYKDIWRAIVQKACSIENDYRRGMEVLAKHMTTSRSSGGAKVRLKIPAKVAAQLGHNVRGDRPVTVQTTGKAVVSAAIGPLLQDLEYLQAQGTVDAPFLVSTRTVPLRKTRTIFMVPTSLQLPISLLYEASGLVMKEGIQTADHYFPPQTFVPAQKARTDFEKGAGLMLVAAMSISEPGKYCTYYLDFPGQDRHSERTVHWTADVLEEFTPMSPTWEVTYSTIEDGRPVTKKVHRPWTQLCAAALRSTTDSWYTLSQHRPGSDGKPSRLKNRSTQEWINLPADIPPVRLKLLGNPSGVFVTERLNTTNTASVTRHLKILSVANGDDTMGADSSQDVEGIVARMVTSARANGQDVKPTDCQVEFGSFLRISYAGMAMIRRHMPFDSEKSGETLNPFTVGSILDKVAKMCRRGQSLEAYSYIRPHLLAAARRIKKWGYVYTAPAHYFAWPGKYPGSVGPLPCSPTPWALSHYESRWREIMGMTLDEPLEIELPQFDTSASQRLADALVGISSDDVSGIELQGRGASGIAVVEAKGNDIPQMLSENLSRPLDPILVRKADIALAAMRSSLSSRPDLFAMMDSLHYKRHIQRSTSQVLSAALVDEKVVESLPERIALNKIRQVDVFTVPNTEPYVFRFEVVGEMSLKHSRHTKLECEMTFDGFVESIEIPKVGLYDIFDDERMFMTLFGYTSSPSHRQVSLFPRSRSDINDTDYLRLVSVCQAHGISSHTLWSLLGLPEWERSKIESLFQTNLHIKALAEVLKHSSYITCDAFSSIDGHMIMDMRLVQGATALSEVEMIIFERLLMAFTLTSWSLNYPRKNIYRLHVLKNE